MYLIFQLKSRLVDGILGYHKNYKLTFRDLKARIKLNPKPKWTRLKNENGLVQGPILAPTYSNFLLRNELFLKFKILNGMGQNWPLDVPIPIPRLKYFS